MDLAANMEAMQPIGEEIVTDRGLIGTAYTDIANWSFLDACLNYSEDVVLSTIRIQQAGFHEVIDTHDSLRRQIRRLQVMKLVP